MGHGRPERQDTVPARFGLTFRALVVTFTFVHTADWQIGKTFGAFPEEKASVLRHARLDAIDRIAEAARELATY